MKEIWKDIKDYEGLYQVSNFGRVKNRKNHILILSLNKNNSYYRVHLCKNGKAKWLSIHRLVAQAFIPNPDNLPEVNHEDENPSNNYASNLKWCTHAYNVKYGTRNKRISETKTNNTYNTKQVQCIETGIIYPSMKEAERQTGIFATSIKQVCKKRQKTAGGYHWKYYIERNDK